MSEFSDKIRADFGKGDRKRDKGLSTPPGVVRFDNISYGTHPEWNLLDVYRPEKTSDQSIVPDTAGATLPVIVIVHGGAWVYGDKDVYQFYGMSLAKRGFAVVNYSYRLAPEYKFPASLEDTCQVFKWIAAHAEEYGLDTARVFAVGDSAGAHLLGLFANLCTNPAYKKAMRLRYPGAKLTVPRGIGLKAVALNCGKYDLKADNPEDTNLEGAIKDYLPEGGDSEELELTDVCKYITDKFPQSFIMTCPGDFLRSQAVLLADALTSHSVPFCYRYYGSRKNPLHHVFHCNVRLEEGMRCNDDECAFFRNLQ